MIIETKNKQQILLRRLNPDDFDKLSKYFQQLSSETVRRFGPHGFDKKSIVDLFKNSDEYIGYIAQDIETSEIIAYSIIKTGYLEHDCFRLQSYGLTLNNKTDCTFAPSVADAWQSLGVGNSLFHFTLSDLKSINIKRIILWGGVQADNYKAVNYYTKHGFRTLGEFEYNGRNYDMILEII
jgi:GNAT superfamily N-acetyltransferase